LKALKNRIDSIGEIHFNTSAELLRVSDEFFKKKQEVQRLIEINKSKEHELNIAKTTKTNFILKQEYLCYLIDLKKNPKNSVLIGSKVWMTHNLNVDRFSNGDSIKKAGTKDEWKRAFENREPAWCYFMKNGQEIKEYGKLYNCWAIRDQRNLAPEDWHIPSEKEWRLLVEHLGGQRLAGEKMKTQTGWEVYHQKAEFGLYGEQIEGEHSFSGNGTNSSGFSGEPFGDLNYGQVGNSFYGLGESTMWWSSTIASWTKNEVTFGLNNSGKFVNEANNCQMGGMYVRCVKD